ncbi:trypsin-like serine peptidase [[Micrococcus luteus] ATCC 49442]|uniref:trypsin-like serine peptidase n=1 Tax=[Micrococcus luteus] ATCC 49442 TaxID=2698727 RepID=UPI0013DAE340|nr:serine protease [[Micrococcus luteus] ATCC 49442]
MTDAVASPTAWWDDPATNWDDPGPRRLVLLLEHAYTDAGDVRRAGVAIGLDPSAGGRSAEGDMASSGWRSFLAAASRRGQVLDLAAHVLHDQGVSEFHAPLRSLLGDRLGEVNARILLHYGLPPRPAEGADTFVDSILAAEVVPGRHGELQTITSPGQGFVDPRAHLQAMGDMLRRTAMIEVGGFPAGTGFLVGEDLLLTAAHVLDRYHWPPSPLPAVRAIFDFEDAGRSAAEAGTPVQVKEFITGSLPTQDEAANSAIDNWDAPADRLDFALLRLARTVPDFNATTGTATQRGFYSLLPDEYVFAAQRQYYILQHPLGGFVQLSSFSGRPLLSAGGTRMRYAGNTLAGSSGSPVVDFRGRLVGLHHYATPGRNQGIPIWMIARALLNGAHSSLFTGAGPVAAAAAVREVDPFATVAVLRRPFVDRQNLRKLMREMVERRDSYRTLAINGASSRAGVSYSYQLASHVSDQAPLCAALRAAAPGGIKVVKIDLRDFLKAGVERARTDIGLAMLLELGIISAPSDIDAQAARGTATLVATLSAKLRRSDAQWWIFFDSLDNVQAVKQGDVDELVHALIKLADDVPVPLRVVVAGREAQKFADEHTAWAARDAAAGLTRGDVEAWLRKRADEEMRGIDEAKLAAKLTSLFPPGPLPEPEQLALCLPAALEEVLAS